MDLIIKNARLRDRDELQDILIENGMFKKIGKCSDCTAGKEIDAAGNLLVPPFIDPHIHLDAVLTAGIPRFNESGSHPEGIEVWGEYKQAYPEFEDFMDRATQAIHWEVALGTLHIRTHIDVCDPSLRALRKMLELREKVRDIADIQIVAFPQDGILSFPNGKELMEEALKLGADLLGGIPHCEWTREDGVESINIIYDLAEKYDRDIDIHCDETDDDQSRFLEVLAAQAIRRGYGSRVSAGHTTAMHSYNNAYANKLQELLFKSKINIIANPYDNSVLQGRFDTYPKRRGITRVKELLEAGVNVSLGHDSIMDPWYPLGYGDMLGAARLAIHLCHMSGFEEINRMFDTITVNSGITYGIEKEYGIKEGLKANCVLLDAGSVFDALRLSPARLFVVREGRIVAQTEQANSQIHTSAGSLPVVFRRN